MDALAARLEQAYPATNERQRRDRRAAAGAARRRHAADAEPAVRALSALVLLHRLRQRRQSPAGAGDRAPQRTGRPRRARRQPRTARRATGDGEPLLALTAGALGLVLARWSVAAFVAAAPAGLPRLGEVGIDGRVLAVCARGVGGVEPGVRRAARASSLARRSERNRFARAGAAARSAAAARVCAACSWSLKSRWRWRWSSAPSLLIRSFIALGHVSLGIQRRPPAGVADERADADRLAQYRRARQRATAFYADVLTRLASVPGVTSVAGIRGLPAARSRFGHESNGGYWLEGGQDPSVVGVRLPQAAFTVVTPDYFKTMQIPLRRGRDFSARDRYDAPFVVDRQRGARASGVRRRGSDRPRTSPAASTRRSS